MLRIPEKLIKTISNHPVITELFIGVGEGPCANRDTNKQGGALYDGGE